ncbi:ABC transporter permease subunit [Clostridium estertheticum]|uniref:ABC transporter permease n=1 Tax=Clostridium estertheticum TaxID=238834 RepID=UPI0013E96FC5|nr:ABC transporter permease subunit [Clostridium estertheticum]MBZ9685634.1 ABC transporter permease subunit [Clostridium estertheticum]
MGFLISNELKKLISRKRFTVTLIMICILGALNIFGTYKNTKKDNIQSKIARAENNVEYYNQQKKTAEENKDKDGINHYKIQMKAAKSELDSFKKYADKSTSWKEKLETDIASSEELKRAPMISSSDTEIENQNKNILIKQYYLNNNIEYDYMKTNQIFKVFPIFFNGAGRLLLFVVIGLLASDIVSGENNSATIKMLLTKPISRGKILFSKFITAIITANVMVIVTETIGFVVIGLLAGFGSPNTPIAVGTIYKMDLGLIGNNGKSISAILGSSYILPAWKVIISIIVLQVLTISACIAFSFLISTLIKNSDVSTGVCIITVFLTMVIAINVMAFAIPGAPTMTNKILPFIFASYYDVSSIFACYYDVSFVLQGDMAERIINPIVNLHFAQFISLVWIIGCYSISHIVFVRKDVL